MMDVETYQDNKTTVVTTYWWDEGRGELVWFAGVANRCPEDKFDREIGQQLALSRSLAKAAKYFERQANGRVKHADWKRRQQAQRQMKDPDGFFAKRRADRWDFLEEYAGSPIRAMAYEEDNARGDR